MASAVEPRTSLPDRRLRRREQTIDEILERAVQIMAEDGVGGLTMAKLARSMGIQPPSLYKYFPSLVAVYDALFRRGQQANLDALRNGMQDAAKGLDAVLAGLEAAGRWAVSHPVVAQLLFWRPIPGYRPAPDAFAPALVIIETLRGALADAAAAGQIRGDGATDDAMAMLSALHFGVLSQHLANDPDSDWATGRFTRLHGQLVGMFFQAYHVFPGIPEP